jgi:hypothetical protein
MRFEPDARLSILQERVYVTPLFARELSVSGLSQGGGQVADLIDLLEERRIDPVSATRN